MGEPICAICCDAVAAKVPLVFNHGAVVHLDCYTQTEVPAALLRSLLESQLAGGFCHTCLARHLTWDRQEIEKAVTGLELTKSVAVEFGVCAMCTRARVTIRLRQAADSARPA